jgi:Stress responsive A/B Barrel Domain
MTLAQQRPVRHIVVFKFKPDAASSGIQQVTDALRALQGSIPGILSVEHGVNNSPEGKNLGFTHVFLITFEDAAARDAYLPHPEHKAFGAVLRSLDVLGDVFVVDYEPAS